MKWVKKGLIFKPQGDIDWMVSHAMIPFAETVGGDLHRVYFAARDSQNRSNGAYVVIDIRNPKEILDISKEPVLVPGDLGTFDDSGALPSWVVEHGNAKYMYYIGYNIGVTVPFRNFIGLAISQDGGASFHKVSRAPLLERNEVDPYLTVTPCVLIEDGLWRMWYTSATKWVQREDDKPKHYYHIKYAESDDGVHWDRQGVVCIDFQSADEYAIARPSVIREDALYKMWYCHRGESYRIGYAESKDGIEWERKDEEVGVDVSALGWDSEMIEYPFVFDHKGERYMIYNGNGYGKTGMGLAVLAKEE
jgi:predicted GH43/DUF377 family glycosyl hydrolase